MREERGADEEDLTIVEERRGTPFPTSNCNWSDLVAYDQLQERVSNMSVGEEGKERNKWYLEERERESR